jgi:DNA topoisomerase-3
MPYLIRQDSLLWHEQQKAIQSGKHDTVSFVTALMEYIGTEVASVKKHGLNIDVEMHPCPTCKKALMRFKKKDKNEFFWGCSGFVDGCKYACEDKAGKPVPKAKVSELHKCKACGKGLSRRPSPKKTGMFWWSCSGYPECKQSYDDAKGTPNYTKRTTATA